MKIEAGNAAFPRIQSSQSSRANPAASDFFSRAMSGAIPNSDQVVGGNATQPDFTNMTRAELFGWMNEKIAGGEMSLDQSSAFLGMTIEIPVDASQVTPGPIEDNERINVVQIANDGIQGALSRNDDATRHKLEIALQFISETRIDRRA